MYVCTLIVELQRAGWEPVVVCVRDSRADHFLREHGVEVRDSGGSGYFNVHDIGLVRRLIRERQAIAVHSHTRFDVWTASLAARFAPRVRFVHSVYMNVAPKRDPIHTSIYSRADAILSSSEIINREIRERYPVDQTRVHLLRYGIDLRPYAHDPHAREQRRAALGVAPDQMLVGMMGRIDTQKGVHEFVESYTLLPPAVREHVRYLLIGEPTLARTNADGTPEYETESAACEEYVRGFIAANGLGDRVLRLGFQKEFIPLLNAMDVFVLPSYAETYSLSVLNAMAMGLPVIGTRAGGTSEQIGENERGTLIMPRSAHDIADAVTHYATHPQDRLRHGEAGRAFVQSEHEMGGTIARLAAIYRG